MRGGSFTSGHAGMETCKELGSGGPTHEPEGIIARIAGSRCSASAGDGRAGGEGGRADRPWHWRRLRQRIEQQRSEEHTSELQSLMRISYAVFCLKKKKKSKIN